MSIVPNGKPEMIAAKDNFVPAERKLAEESTTSADELQLRKAKDSFDRSKIPVAGANKAVDVPSMWQQDMANGIRVLGAQSLETPTTSLLLKVPAGHYYETKEKAGTAALLASMLNESTNKRSAEDMSKELQKLGSSVSISSSDHYLQVNINALTKHLDKTLVLVKEKLLEPAFEQSDFERLKNNSIQGVKNSKKNAGYLASTAFRQLMHADNIAAMPGAGNEETLANLKLEDIKQFYTSYFKPKNGQLIVVSDLAQKDVVKSISTLAEWKGEGAKLNLSLPMPDTKPGKVYLVHKDNAAQSAIRIGKRGIVQDITGEFYKSYLMNFPLGGAFNSRINLNLREDKGYTYGARSFFSGDKLAGAFIASAEVRADATDKSVIEFVNEIKGYADKGITSEELAFMRNAINQRDALKYETPRAKLGFLAQILEHDLTPDFVKQRSQIVESISAEEINALAKQHLQLDEMIIVVVGNSEVLKPQLEALGYEVVNYEI